MPKTAKEMEKIILADGWRRTKGNHGSHRQYKHPVKPGKVTIPYHGKKALTPKVEKEIYRQAGLKK